MNADRVSLGRILRQSIGSALWVAIAMAVLATAQAPVLLDGRRAFAASPSTEVALEELRGSQQWQAVKAQVLPVFFSPAFKDFVVSQQAPVLDLASPDPSAAERARLALERSLWPIKGAEGRWASLAERLNGVTQTTEWRYVVTKLLAILEDDAMATAIEAHVGKQGTSTSTPIQYADVNPWDWVEEGITFLAGAVTIIVGAVVCGVSVICVVGAVAAAVYIALTGANTIERWAKEGRRGMKIDKVVCYVGNYCRVDAQATAMNFVPMRTTATFQFFYDKRALPSLAGVNAPPASGTITLRAVIHDQNMWILFHEMNFWSDNSVCNYQRMDVSVATDWDDGRRSWDSLSAVPVQCAP